MEREEDRVTKEVTKVNRILSIEEPIDDDIFVVHRVFLELEYHWYYEYD